MSDLDTFRQMLDKADFEYTINPVTEKAVVERIELYIEERVYSQIYFIFDPCGNLQDMGAYE